MRIADDTFQGNCGCGWVKLILELRRRRTFIDGPFNTRRPLFSSRVVWYRFHLYNNYLARWMEGLFSVVIWNRFTEIGPCGAIYMPFLVLGTIPHWLVNWEGNGNFSGTIEWPVKFNPNSASEDNIELLTNTCIVICQTQVWLTVFCYYSYIKFCISYPNLAHLLGLLCAVSYYLISFSTL